MNQATRQPSANEFIEFSLYGGDQQDHPVYKWLLVQPSYSKALRRLKHKGQDLDFAQRVSYCIGRYLKALASDAWKHSSRRRRIAATRDYQKVLRWCRSGFGPYAEDDREHLARLLTAASDYLLGKHLSPGFRIKDGEHRSVGMLVRELVVFLDPFDFPSRSLSPVIADLVSIVAEVETRTIERHVEACRKLLEATDQ